MAARMDPSRLIGTVGTRDTSGRGGAWWVEDHRSGVHGDVPLTSINISKTSLDTSSSILSSCSAAVYFSMISYLNSSAASASSDSTYWSALATPPGADRTDDGNRSTNNVDCERLEKHATARTSPTDPTHLPIEVWNEPG